MVRWPSSETPPEPSFDCSLERLWPSMDHDIRTQHLRPNSELNTSQKHCHSISRYLFHFGKGAISWNSKKKHIIVLSSTEDEYITQTQTLKEALWLRSFIKEIREGKNGPLKIKCDNQGAIVLAKDNKSSTWGQSTLICAITSYERPSKIRR